MDLPRDVKPGLLQGGQWKARYFDRLGKHRHVPTALARSYIAVPPPEGWPGGEPARNGWKPVSARK